jgi:iron complex outermembrane recepter protein
MFRPIACARGALFITSFCTVSILGAHSTAGAVPAGAGITDVLIGGAARAPRGEIHMRPGTMVTGDTIPNSISGRVTDASGQPINGAVVRVVELRRGVTTDSAGRYSITQIRPGSYTLSVSFIGYAPRVSSVTVTDAGVSVDVSLRQSAVELPPVQVSASPSATSGLNSPQPVSVVAGEDIAKFRPTSLGQAIEAVPGVRNNSSGEAAGKPVIRGLTNNRVLVLDNGQRLEHNQWGDDHFSSVEPAAASRIEVIRGPASVLYGSDALGGVINVIEADLPDGIGRTPFVSGSASSGYASGNKQADGSLTLEGASGGFGFRASGTGRTAQDVRTPTYDLWNSGYHNVGGNGTLGYRGDWGSLTGRYTYRNDRLKLTDEDPTGTGRAGTDDHRAHVDLSIPVGASRLDWGAGFELNRRHEWADATTTIDAFGMKQVAYTTDAHLHHPPIGLFSGLIGFSGEYTTDSNFGEEFLEPDNKTSDAALYFFEQGDVGKWNFSFGGRYDYRHLTADANADIGNPNASRSWNSVTGNIGMLYHMTEPAAIVLNVGRGFRSPSAFDLFANGLHEATSTFEHGNPNLKTETSLNGDLALRIQSGSVAAEVGGFVNAIQNFIYTVPTNQTDPETGFEIFDVTQGDAVLSGFEGQVEYHPTGWLHLQGGADYVYGQNTSTDDPLPSMPPFRATYLARLERFSLGSLSDAYFSVGGESNARQTRLNPSEAIFYADAFDGEGFRSKAYSLLNVAAGFSVPTSSGKTVKFDFGVRNALDESWVSYMSHLKTLARNPGMGRSLVARISADF